MNNHIPKCKNCKGTGQTKKKDDASKIITCKHCQGTGVRLQNEIDEELDEYFTATKEKIHQDDVGYIEIEEEDYEI